MLHKIKSDRQHRLMVHFKDWFHNKAAVFSAIPLIKFYEFFTLRMEEDDSINFGVASYSELFSEYSREQGLRPLGKRPWSERDAQGQRGGPPRVQQQQPPLQGNGQGAKGGGKGGKGAKGGGKGGRRATHVQRACSWWNEGECRFGTACRFEHICGDCGSPDHKARDATCPSRADQ